MARITLRQLLDHAAENDYGVPAFNINNMEQALAIMDACDQSDAPVIIQASRGARSYAHDTLLKHMMDACVEGSWLFEQRFQIIGLAGKTRSLARNLHRLACPQ
jgi:fructose/tagatose bisphosphate aldolase